MDFSTPDDVATINSVHAEIQPAHKIRGAILYQRKRGYAGSTPAPDGGAYSARRPTPAGAFRSQSPIIIKKKDQDK
jgi:hypothetical protein